MGDRGSGKFCKLLTDKMITESKPSFSFVNVLLIHLYVAQVDASVGAKRVLHEVSLLDAARAGKFINCEDGLEIPF